MHYYNKIVMIFLTAFGMLLGQGKEYAGPEDPAGDIAAEREGYMTGNRVFIYFATQRSFRTGPELMFPNGLTIPMV